ncbi:MAG: twin-arginine translocation signal domain-containing protein, partial [Candidatus Aminicenantes bacterium]|nr:twin-arginine translocation signal domain-containing protein [Candidatus Aminicenantes bacterium]
MKKKTISRRDFIKDGAAALAAGSLVLAWPGKHSAQTPGKTRVVLIRDKDVLDEAGVVRPPAIEKMLDEAVKTLLGEKDAIAAWKKIIRPSDVVGIKSNVWRSLPTPPQLEEAIRSGVLSAGVKAENISVRDRGVLNDPVFMKATALVNVRPLRTHDWSGLGTLVKNYIMFVPDPPRYHPDSCA